MGAAREKGKLPDSMVFCEAPEKGRDAEKMWPRMARRRLPLRLQCENVTTGTATPLAADAVRKLLLLLRLFLPSDSSLLESKRLDPLSFVTATQPYPNE